MFDAGRPRSHNQAMKAQIDLSYPAILQLFREHLDPKRTESASFLIWYLENYYRLDPVEAIDSVCDQKWDKGVDGIFVNDTEGCIYIFQSKISQKVISAIGDTSLKEFQGTLSQFKDETALQNLINTGGKAVVNLVRQLDLITKRKTYSLKGIFLSNTEIDDTGKSFLACSPEITFVGQKSLRETYISSERSQPVATEAEFDVSEFTVSEYIVDANTKSLIAPVKAIELISLHGIADQSLFDYNVRGSLGRTQVNKDIVKSIKDAATHKFFPLFHNGITIICESLDATSDKIKIKNYSVVNGCQSLTALYENRLDLTGDLRILTKFAKLSVPSPLAAQVTRFSNNQNGVKPRDFKANDPLQIRLKNEFVHNYAGQYDLEIKRGEESSSGELITNEDAGLYLMAFDLKEPWGTHRRYQVFDDKHAELFARPEVTADRIVCYHLMAKIIKSRSGGINNTLFGKYALTKFAILYILRNIFESDNAGKDLIQMPSKFVRNKKDRQNFEACVLQIVNEIIVDLNGEVDEIGEDFDYREKLRNSDWVKDIAKKVVGSHIKLVMRNRIPSFEAAWKARN